MNLLLADDFVEEENEAIGRKKRTFNIRRNFLEIVREPSTFREDFRVDMSVVEELLAEIGPLLQHKTNRNYALTPEQQLLSSLHWFGHGSQYHVNARAHGLHKSTVCRYVHKVATLINEFFFHKYVRWPDDVTYVIDDFKNIAGFPDIVGLLDGTLVRIDAPSEDEPAFVDRNNDHSINLTLVAGPKHEFFFASCKCPGSVHDSRALRVSNVWQRWEVEGMIRESSEKTTIVPSIHIFSVFFEGWRPANYPQSVILADSAYPLQSWLLTPNVRAAFVTPNNSAGVRRYTRVGVFE